MRIKATCSTIYRYAKENTPTPHPSPSSNAWFPCPRFIKSRPCCIEATPRKRPRSADGITNSRRLRRVFNSTLESNVLNYKHRFHGHNTVRFVTRTGKVVRSSLLTLKYLDNGHRTSPRIAVVVSKKILKSAVGRNRIRRRIYEFIRTQLPLMKQNSDLVCIVSTSELKSMPTPELHAQLGNMLKQADLYK